MKLKGSRRIRSFTIPRLPLVALIDVVLFILMYFMLATSFSAPENRLATSLQTDARGKSSSLIPQVLKIEPEGKSSVYKIGERSLRDQEALTRVLSLLPKDGGVFVKADGAVPVSSVALAMQACKDAGFSKVSYVAGN